MRVLKRRTSWFVLFIRVVLPKVGMEVGKFANPLSRSLFKEILWPLVGNLWRNVDRNEVSCVRLVTRDFYPENSVGVCFDGELMVIH